MTKTIYLYNEEYSKADVADQLDFYKEDYKTYIRRQERLQASLLLVDDISAEFGAKEYEKNAKALVHVAFQIRELMYLLENFDEVYERQQKEAY